MSSAKTKTESYLHNKKNKEENPQLETLMLGDDEKKYFCDYDSGVTVSYFAGYILNDPDLPRLKSIIVGMWDHEMYDTDVNVIFKMIADNKEKFSHIESLFIGDMDFEENEISWIKQGDYEELLKSLPNLKSLKIKGADGLTLGALDHRNLEELEIICGGLPVCVLNSLKAAKLPNLKKLILYSGDDNYGYDCEISDFADIAEKKLFPELKHLGLTDSEFQNDLVRVILESDILPQLETIDVSCGCLTDEGGQMILDAAGKLSAIKKLNASYHYMSEDMMKKLEALPFEVDVSDEQREDEYEGEAYMYPMITE
jgi:hypothetical protein